MFVFSILDLGRSAVDKENGIPIILNVLEIQNENSEEGAARLRVILCGFLLNLTNNCGMLLVEYNFDVSDINIIIV